MGGFTGDDRLDEFRKQALEAAPPPVPAAPDNKSKKAKKKAATPGDAELGQAGPTAEDRLLKMAEFMAADRNIKIQLKIIAKLQVDIDHEHRKALQAATVEESLNTSLEIGRLTQLADEASKEVRRLLKQIETETEEVAPLASPGSSSLRGRITQHKHLTQKYLETMRGYQRMQQDCSKKYQEQIKRQYLIVQPNATSKEIEAVLHDTEGAQAQVFAMAVRGQAQTELKKMETRCQDMKKLEQSILELSQLFLTMQQQLISQRDVLNKVGVQVHQSEEYTERALKDTAKAVEHAKSYRKKKLIIIGVVGGILFLIILGISVKLFVALSPQRVKLV